MPQAGRPVQLDDGHDLQAGYALVPGRPADDALLALLASMACSDGEVHDKELDFVVKLRPGSRAESEAWVRSHTEPIDHEAMAAVVTDPDDRWKVLRYAARMAWKDGELATEERDLLASLSAALELPRGAVERVLKEMAPRDDKVFTANRLLPLLHDVHWGAVQLAGGNLVSEDLRSVLPEGSELVARVGLDKVEVMAICTNGLVARFQQGPAFIGWAELVTYTRSFGLGASVELHTEDGRSYSLVDSRLSGLGPLLDRIFAGPQPQTRSGPPPKIETRSGADD